MGKKLETHETRVLKYLYDVGSITSLDAIREFGNTRLSATIYNLRNKGYQIVSEDETSKNRYGEKTTFARYYLKSAKRDNNQLTLKNKI